MVFIIGANKAKATPGHPAEATDQIVGRAMPEHVTVFDQRKGARLIAEAPPDVAPQVEGRADLREFGPGSTIGHVARKHLPGEYPPQIAELNVLPVIDTDRLIFVLSAKKVAVIQSTDRNEQSVVGILDHIARIVL